MSKIKHPSPSKYRKQPPLVPNNDPKLRQSSGLVRGNCTCYTRAVARNCKGGGAHKWDEGSGVHFRPPECPRPALIGGEAHRFQYHEAVLDCKGPVPPHWQIQRGYLPSVGKRYISVVYSMRTYYIRSTHQAFVHWLHPLKNFWIAQNLLNGWTFRC